MGGVDTLGRYADILGRYKGGATKPRPNYAVPVSLTEAEYTVLRQTIATRGTVRMVLLPITLLGWSALVLAIFIVGGFPVASLVSLTVLVGGFEAIHALHVGVERVGRYLQVYYESESGSPHWESTVTAIGPALPGGGIDPLFSFVFAGVAFINMIPALLPSPTRLELAVIGIVHIGFGARVGRARGAAARQRAVDLESFRAVQRQQIAAARSSSA